jgi:hypothetical protein
MLSRQEQILSVKKSQKNINEIKQRLMKQLQLLIFLFLFFIVNSSSTKEPQSPQIVKGRVVDNVSQQPVEGAYIYIVSGEEEALSSKDGLFEITTWQALPVTIKINHDHYQRSEVVYKKGEANRVIKLPRK